MSYSAYFTLSIREAEHVLKALVITVILVGCVQAQEQQEPSNFDIPPRAHQEFLRKTSEGEIERTSSSRRQQVRLAQIREDSRAIQTINAVTANALSSACSACDIWSSGGIGPR